MLVEVMLLKELFEYRPLTNAALEMSQPIYKVTPFVNWSAGSQNGFQIGPNDIWAGTHTPNTRLIAKNRSTALPKRWPVYYTAS